MFKFTDQNHGEDQVFADKVVAKYRSAGKQDFARSCLLFSTTSTSRGRIRSRLCLQKTHLAHSFFQIFGAEGASARAPAANYANEKTPEDDPGPWLHSDVAPVTEPATH